MKDHHADGYESCKVREALRRLVECGHYIAPSFHVVQAAEGGLEDCPCMAKAKEILRL